MNNRHDAVFKDLITNRDFAVSFLKQYMPSELVSLIDWGSVRLDSANVEHTRVFNCYLKTPFLHQRDTFAHPVQKILTS